MQEIPKSLMNPNPKSRKAKFAPKDEKGIKMLPLLTPRRCLFPSGPAENQLLR
jgi:hypothetical protein